MKKFLTFCLLIGIVLCIAGGIMLGYGIKTDAFTKDNKRVINTYDITETFDSINVDVTTGDVVIKPAEDDKVTIICKESEKYQFIAEVKENVLTIDDKKSSKNWIDNISIYTFNNRVTIYLPFDTLKNVNIETTTGDITIDSINADKFELKATTGDVKLNNSVATDLYKVIVTTGDIEFTRIDSKSIVMRTTTGDISGSILTGKKFECSTTHGDKDYPKDSTGDPCILSTTTGDIEVTICE
ncbi:MAG: DUF4097 domain-containing protein [Acholeplasmatales bacterium]|nr:DUF4097 domain-containing protein [Acholeplasmatales bacterium]